MFETTNQYIYAVSPTNTPKNGRFIYIKIIKTQRHFDIVLAAPRGSWRIFQNRVAGDGVKEGAGILGIVEGGLHLQRQ
jgi:hypothetical protein